MNRDVTVKVNNRLCCNNGGLAYNSPSSSLSTRSRDFLARFGALAPFFAFIVDDGSGECGEDEAGAVSSCCLGGELSSSEASPANASNSASRSSAIVRVDVGQVLLSISVANISQIQ